MDNNNKTSKHNCCCVTKGGNKECLNDFNCQKCGVCLNWRGYEEGTINCGCIFKNKLKSILPNHISS